MNIKTCLLVITIIFLEVSFSYGQTAYGYYSKLENVKFSVPENDTLPDEFTVQLDYFIDSNNYDKNSQYTISAGAISIYGTKYNLGEHMVPNTNKGSVKLQFKMISKKENLKNPLQIVLSLSRGSLQFTSTRYFIFLPSEDDPNQ